MKQNQVRRNFDFTRLLVVRDAKKGVAEDFASEESTNWRIQLSCLLKGYVNAEVKCLEMWSDGFVPSKNDALEEGEKQPVMFLPAGNEEHGYASLNSNCKNGIKVAVPDLKDKSVTDAVNYICQYCNINSMMAAYDGDLWSMAELAQRGNVKPLEDVATLLSDNEAQPREKIDFSRGKRRDDRIRGEGYSLRDAAAHSKNPKSF